MSDGVIVEDAEKLGLRGWEGLGDGGRGGGREGRRECTQGLLAGCVWVLIFRS